jgi:hypothetical protein
MSSNLKKHLNKLLVICEIKKPTLRRAILRQFSEDKTFCKAIREIMKNIANKNIVKKLKEAEKRQLRKCGRLIVKLLKKRLSHKRQKQLVEQTGSGPLLPLILPIVAEIIGTLIQNARR